MQKLATKSNRTGHFSMALHFLASILLGISLFCFIPTYAQSAIPNPDKEAKQKALPQQHENKNSTPIGLFTYNRWVDLNENAAAERNEFFGLGKNIFSDKENLSATLYDPQITKDTKIKIRIWDHTGNLLRTSMKTYIAGQLFTLAHIEKILPPGDYVLTINPAESEKTYQVSFSINGINSNTTGLAVIDEPLPNGLYLFTHWVDRDGDMEFDRSEMIGLDTSRFEPEKADFAVALVLPEEDQQVVYQTWDDAGKLLGITISNLVQPQYYRLSKDSMLQEEIPNFLSPLLTAKEGTYQITATLANKELTQYGKSIHFEKLIASSTSGQTVLKGKDFAVEETMEPRPGMVAPITLKGGLQGFFLFADYIDLNHDNLQQEFEFVKLRQKIYNSKIDNVFAQFYYPKYQNHQILLRILDGEGNTIIEQQTLYRDKPYIFEISNARFRLAPGQYLIQVFPENSKDFFEENLVIR